MPFIALAGGFRFGVMRTVEYGQVQRVGAFAAVGVLVIIGVNARSRVGFTVPDKTLASRFGFGVMRAVEDSQVQRIDAFATVSVLVNMGVNA